MIKERGISSRELSSGAVNVIGRETGALDIYAGLSTPFSSDFIVLDETHRKQIEEFAAASANSYGPANEEGLRDPEPTYVQNKYSVPTLIGRVDCTIDDVGNITAYEMEDSPSGLGVTTMVQQAIGAEGVAEPLRNHYYALLGELPYVIVSGSRNHGTDDAAVVGSENYFYETANMQIPPIPENQPVIVKAIPGQPESLNGYAALQDRSVCTMQSEGDKTYGERVGLYQRIENINDLPQNESGMCSQAIKRRLSSMAMGIKLYLNPEDKKKYGSARTISAAKLGSTVCGFLSMDGYAYTQLFQPAIQAVNPEGRNNLILRVYTLIEPGINGTPATARAIGGCYVARKEVVVHGASNAICGAVITKDTQNER